MSWREELRTFFGDSERRRVVIVGIGSPMRHDDVIGLKVLELLEDKPLDDVILLPTETVPENYTGVIRDFKPTHVLIIDAANFSGEPGEGRIISHNAIVNTSVSTHSLPLNIFINYVRKSICENVALLGIQVVNIKFGEGVTPEVEEGAVIISKMLLDLLYR